MTHQNITGWTKVKRDVYIDADLESSPLEIMTDSSLGSGEKVEVHFYTSEEGYAGGVILHFTSTPRYQLWTCTNSRNNFLTELPTDTNKVWKISQTKTSDIRLVIHCNEEEVVNVILSDTTCGDSRWSSLWKGDVEKISFHEDDTASDYYTGKGNCR